MTDWINTEEPGIYKHSKIPGKFKIDTTTTLKTGARKRKRKVIEESTMLEARQARGELKAAMRRAPDQHQVLLLTDFAADWMRDRIDENRWAESTIKKNTRILKHHVIPVLGDLYVDEVDRVAISKWIDYANGARRVIGGESVPYSHHTLRTWWGRVKEIVTALYLAGHSDRLLLDWCKDRRGPTSKVTNRKESETLTRSELVAYIEKTKEVAPTRYAEIVTLAYTGMRAGELYGLEWRHIELEARIVIVEQSISRTGKIKCTKTGKTRRPPLSPVIADALEEHRSWLMRMQNPGLHDGIVFPSATGGRRLSASLRKPMLKVARACDLDINVGPQVLRKTFITLVGAAHNRELVKSITGHETDEMHEHYTHIRPETQYDAVLDFFGKEVGQS